MDIKDLKNDEIKNLITLGKITIADLVDNGICPTCFDKDNDNILYGDNRDRMLYEDEDFECLLISNPRAHGHTIISTKVHYKDMMEIEDCLCSKLFLLAKKVMKAIKDVYQTESVYLCTMCDGPMNHLHVQLIPRYAYEKRGSKNFVKPRFEYVIDKEKIDAIRKIMNYKPSK